MKRQCNWWCAACGGEYDWLEADKILTIQASCTIFKMHAPLQGVCDDRISGLKLLANLQDKENFIEVVFVGIKEGSMRKIEVALRQFIEVDNHKALVSVKPLDRHRVVKEVVGPAKFEETWKSWEHQVDEVG